MHTLTVCKRHRQIGDADALIPQLLVRTLQVQLGLAQLLDLHSRTQRVGGRNRGRPMLALEHA